MIGESWKDLELSMHMHTRMHACMPHNTALLPEHNASVCAQGVVNRDIKLENTLLDNSPRPLVKVCDFGYSKVHR